MENLTVVLPTKEVVKLNDLITSKEVSKILDCTPRYVRRLAQTGKLKPIKILEGGHYLFNTKDVELFVFYKWKQKKIKPLENILSIEDAKELIKSIEALEKL